VLYLGEINSSQEVPWRKSIEVFEEGTDRPRTLALFPEDRCEDVLPDAAVVRCGSRRSDCAGRGNGAPAGWP
jgi:hypothetical protein